VAKRGSQPPPPRPKSHWAPNGESPSRLPIEENRPLGETSFAPKEPLPQPERDETSFLKNKEKSANVFESSPAKDWWPKGGQRGQPVMANHEDLNAKKKNRPLSIQQGSSSAQRGPPYEGQPWGPPRSEEEPEQRLLAAKEPQNAPLSPQPKETIAFAGKDDFRQFEGRDAAGPPLIGSRSQDVVNGRQSAVEFQGYPNPEGKEGSPPFRAVPQAENLPDDGMPWRNAITIQVKGQESGPRPPSNEAGPPPETAGETVRFFPPNTANAGGGPPPGPSPQEEPAAAQPA